MLPAPFFLRVRCGNNYIPYILPAGRAVIHAASFAGFNSEVRHYIVFSILGNKPPELIQDFSERAIVAVGVARKVIFHNYAVFLHDCRALRTAINASW